MYNTLIEVDELNTFLNTDTKICVFDCRFSLNDTSAGKKLWLTSHLPNAHYAHLDDNLSSKIRPGLTGRHPLPKKERFAQWLAQHGVDKDTQIVAYDAAGGAIAARLWWLSRWIGHSHCAVLNGGYNAWEANYETNGCEARAETMGSIRVDTALVKSLQTQAILEHDHTLLIDAREHPRYLGEQEPIDPVSGHIPGALSYPFAENLDRNGKFKGSEELRSRYSPLNDIAKEKELIMYCGSGVTAIHNILAMAVAGFETPTLYEDSWSGWILDPTREVAIGDTTGKKHR